MTKNELIEKVAEGANISKKDAGVAVKVVFDSISDAMVVGEGFQLTGFGTFGVKDRPERTVRNPRTGEQTVAPATRVPVFKPGKGLKEAVKG